LSTGENMLIKIIFKLHVAEKNRRKVKCLLLFAFS